MKPNLAFLAKVRAGEVRRVSGYKKKTGGYTKFIGGEMTAQKHADAGYIVMPGYAGLGRPSRAALTDLGISALAGVK